MKKNTLDKIHKTVGFVSVVALLVTQNFYVFALNDTTKTWQFNASTASDYTYDSTLITVDANGAGPVSNVNKITNPDFTSNNTGWSTAAIAQAGYVEVPTDATYNTGNFLVAQYEAKYDCTGDGVGNTAATCSAVADSGAGVDYRDLTFDSANVVSTAEGTPIVHITKPQAADACPAPYDLITNDQYMTIARNIESQTSNWADGTVGSTVSSGGGLKRGNVGVVDSASYNGADPEGGTGRDTKAKHTLSNGNEIWDLSGNVWDIVNFDADGDGVYDEAEDLISEQDQPEKWDGSTTALGWGWSGFTSSDPVSTYYLQNSGSGVWGYDDFRPSDSTLDALEGVGRIYHSSNSASTTKNRVVLRGGYWYSTGYAGVFATYLFWTTSSQSGSVGFRCSSGPVEISQSFSSSLGRDSGGGNSVTAGSVVEGKLYQSINVGTADTFDFSAYVYDNTSGNVGGTVDSTIAQLYYNDAVVSTTYTSAGSGWYKLTGTLTGANESREYGLQIEKGKTVIVDDFTLSKQGEYSLYTTSAYSNSNVQSWDSFTDTSSSSGNASIVYQLCTDDGSTCESGNSWQYYTGSAWATASNTTTHTNTKAQLTQAAMQALSVSSTKISVKAILNFGGSDTPDLDSFAIGLTTDVDAPTISLTALATDPTTDTTPTLTGSVTEDIDTVSSVEYQIDSTSGSWSACTADDGAFDEITEAFTCTVSIALADGSHTMYVRSTDSNSNTTSDANAATDTFTVDTTEPISFDLDSPGNKTYTNDERPEFSFEATTDATSNLSEYNIEIDNGENGDFSFSGVPVSGTSDYKTSKYVASFDNFSDGDSTNDRISVQARSSSDWGSDSNNGKLKEGKRKWTVKAKDAAGNERSESRTLFVDRTAPSIDVKEINDIDFVDDITTTDTTPTIKAKVTDKLAGDKDENKVASGPKKAEIKFEQLNFAGGSDLISNATVNLPEIKDNTKQDSDKDADFTYTLSDPLPIGNYRVVIVPTDNVDNVGDEVEFYLNIVPVKRITKAKEIIKDIVPKITKEEDSPLDQPITADDSASPPASIDDSKEAFEITVPTSELKPTVFEKLGQGISSAFNTVGSGFNYVGGKLGDGLAFVGTSISTSVGNGWSFVAYNSPKAVSNTMDAIGEKVANASFAIGEKTQNVSEKVGFVFVKFGYLFVKEPTTIADVQVEVLSATEAKISWVTNHPANGKVNYGFGSGDYIFEVQDSKRVIDHEFILTDLKPDTEYNFEVMSQNKNYVYDANRTFRTFIEETIEEVN